jgi:two-component system invasion response regulator UvrY
MLINVVLVDDHDVVMEGVAMLLADTPIIAVVGKATSGEDAIVLVKEKQPDVVLMDLRMPGMGGLQAGKQILLENPGVKLIALTTLIEAPFPERVLQAGFSGYLSKNTNIVELVLVIKAVHAGKRYITPEIAKNLAFQSIQGNLPPAAKLSERELEVMMLIIKGHKVAEIAEMLGVKTKTINTFRYRAFEKLEVKNNVDLTHLAVRYGMLEIEKI